MVERFRPYCWDSKVTPTVRANSNGDYVLYSDYAKLETESKEWRDLYEHGLEDRNDLLERAKSLEAALSADQCRRVLSDLIEREWTGLTHDDIRMIDKLIFDARTTVPETDCGNG